MKHCAIVQFESSVVAEALHLPPGTLVTGVRMDPFRVGSIIEFVVEHPNLPLADYGETPQLVTVPVPRW